MSSPAGTSSQVISLPKGGGALGGIGEKFAPDLYTGTGNLTVPIALPPGRNGLQPQLSLAYSTGNGNGPFGLGWSLSVPGVSRKTSRGVPRYDDADTFILSGRRTSSRSPGAGPGSATPWWRPASGRHTRTWPTGCRTGSRSTSASAGPGDVPDPAGHRDAADLPVLAPGRPVRRTRRRPVRRQPGHVGHAPAGGDVRQGVGLDGVGRRLAGRPPAAVRRPRRTASSAPAAGSGPV